MDQRDADVSLRDRQHDPGVEVEGGDRHWIKPRANQLLCVETLRLVWLWGLGWGGVEGGSPSIPGSAQHSTEDRILFSY